MSNSVKFLITATLCLLVCLVVYNPHPMQIESEIEHSEVEGEFQLYSNDIFMYSEFEFVKASANNGYALYEVIGDGELIKLKSELQDYLKNQGCELEVMIMVLDKDNTERVREIL